MDGAARRGFEASEGVVDIWPEIGTRAAQRLLVVGAEVFSEGWLVVQDGNYRYKVSQEDGLSVKIVLREYLACHIAWS